MKGFSKTGLASTFSPRFVPLLAEAHGFSASIGAEFHIVYAGNYGKEEEEHFSQAFAELKMEPAPKVHAAQGEPAEAIMQAARNEGIDLLIAGALERETGGRSFLGGVARKLLSDSPISLMLFPHPSTEPRTFKKLAVVVDFSPLSKAALEQAIFIAEKHGAESIHVVRIFTIFDQALSKPSEFFQGGKTTHAGLAEEQEQLERFVNEAGETPVEIEARCVEGTTGFAASDFVQAIEADLLVIPSEAPGSQYLFPQGMDWVFNVIPTNLLVVRGQTGRRAGPAGGSGEEAVGGQAK